MEATKGQLQAAKLWQRLAYSRNFLKPVDTDIRIVFEDPLHPDEPPKVVIASGHWLAMALHGNILPSINAYLNLPLEQYYKKGGVVSPPVFVKGSIAAKTRWRMKQDGWNFIGEKVCQDHTLHTSDVMPAMTIPEAIEYLLKKEVPYHVWGEKHNRQMYFICRADQLPERDEFRNAWEMADV